MRPFVLFLLFALSAFSADQQSLAEIKQTIATLKLTIAQLEAQVAALEGGAAVAPARSLASPVTAPAPRQSSTRVQCQATTKKGTQCSRMSEPGRNFCWQHGGR